MPALNQPAGLEVNKTLGERSEDKPSRKPRRGRGIWAGLTCWGQRPRGSAAPEALEHVTPDPNGDTPARFAPLRKARLPQQAGQRTSLGVRCSIFYLHPFEPLFRQSERLPSSNGTFFPDRLYLKLTNSEKHVAVFAPNCPEGEDCLPLDFSFRYEFKDSVS